MPTIIDAEISLPNISTSYKEQKADWQENNVSLVSHILNRTHHLYNTTPIIESKVVTFSVSGQTTTATILGLTLSEGYYWMSIRGMEGIYKCTKEGTVYIIQIEHNPDNITFTYNEGDENTTVVNTTTLTAHSTDISISSTDVKQLDEYYIPDTIARTSQVMQSDWEQNDITSPTHILNRTHYIDKRGTKFTVQTFELTGSDNYAAGSMFGYQNYPEGLMTLIDESNFMQLTVGTNIFEGEIKRVPGGFYIGNGYLYNLGNPNTGENWCFYCYPAGLAPFLLRCDASLAGIYTDVIVFPCKQDYIPLDERFIPNSITRNGDLSTVATSGSYTDLSDTPIIADIADARIGIHDTDSNAHNRVDGRVGTIEGVIPSEVYDEGNELADRFFVNSTVSTATATFRGNHNIVTDLGLSVSSTHAQIATALGSTIATADKNDYCNVEIPSTSFSEFNGYESFTSVDDYVEKYVIYNDSYTYVTDSNKSSLTITPGTTIAYSNNLLRVDRYKYVTVEGGTDYWDFDYTYNNSGFTAGQWSTINSGLTTNDAVLIQLLNTSKADKVTGATNGDIAVLDANGNLKDSGKSINDFKLKQQNVVDPTASGESITFIDSISQNEDGVIAPIKKTVKTATSASGDVPAAAGLMSSSDKSKLDSIANGAQVNAIEGVKVNGQLVVPDSDKNVNVTIQNPDWNQTTSTVSDYIKNKPAIKAGRGVNSIIEGDIDNNVAGNYSHAEGGGTQASGDHSHAEGVDTTASGACSHAEGAGTTASGSTSHAEGTSTKASGASSHAEGTSTKATGDSSHTEGNGTIANNKCQHVFGEYNGVDPSSALSSVRGTYIEIVGNGTTSSARSNARTLDWSGNETLAGNLTIGGTITANGQQIIPQKQADWNQTTSTESDYIKNKPTKLSDFINDGEGESPLNPFTTIEDVTNRISAHNSDITTHEDIRLSVTSQGGRISAVEELIPVQATSSNNLADKEFVNSSISTNTANFKGTYNTLAELEATTADNNDYGFIITTDTSGNTLYNRYKYDGTSWSYEYSLNNSAFTAAQWEAIQSGITSDSVAKLNGVVHDACKIRTDGFTKSSGALAGSLYIWNTPRAAGYYSSPDDNIRIFYPEVKTANGTISADSSGVIDISGPVTDEINGAVGSAIGSLTGEINLKEPLLPAAPAQPENKFLNANKQWVEIAGGGQTTVYKSITIENPTASENMCIFYAPVAMTITEIRGVITGATSVSFKVVSGTSRNAVTTEHNSSAVVCSSVTTGDVATITTGAVAAGSWVAVKTSAIAGAPSELVITLSLNY